MVGKIKRIRQKLHQDAVKVGESNLEKAPLLSEAKPFALPGVINPFDVNKNDKSTDVTFKVCTFSCVNLTYCRVTDVPLPWLENTTL